MPKRKSIKRHESTEIQGEDSFVVLASVKVGRIRKLRTGKEEEEGLDLFTIGIELLSEHIVNWNWVDDLGEPLPTPKEDPNVIDELTEEEASYLVQLLISSDTSKN